MANEIITIEKFSALLLGASKAEAAKWAKETGASKSDENEMAVKLAYGIATSYAG